jgi:hypothetical protein
MTSGVGGHGSDEQGEAEAGELRDAGLDRVPRGCGYQPRRWPKMNSGTGAGGSAQSATGSTWGRVQRLTPLLSPCNTGATPSGNRSSAARSKYLIYLVDRAGIEPATS